MSVGSSPPSPLPKTRKLRIVLAYYAAALLLGLMLTSIGPCLDAFKAQTGSSTGAIALLFTASSLGYIAGSVLAGRVYARIAGHRALAAALGLMCLLTITLPWLEPLWLLITVIVLIGVALGSMDVGANTLTMWLYRQEVPPYMNALHLSFGIGAFIGPLIIDRFAVGTGDAVHTYWLYAGLMIPAAVWLARLPSPDRPPEATTPAGARALFRPYALFLGLLCLFFFMHFGGELAFGGWIYSYAKADLGSETIARVVNSVFWGGLVVGRIIAVPVALRLSPSAMLQSSLVGTVVALGLIIAFPNVTAVLWIGTIAFGMAIASVLANSFTFTGERMPVTSQITAILIVGGSVGSMTLPWVIGQFFDPDHNPASRTWVIYVIEAAMVAALILFAVIRVYARRFQKGTRAPA
jgi:FHS family Na+ dependent glucose MFS transporter 1